MNIKIEHIGLLSLVIVLLSFPYQAQAQSSFRCGPHIIQGGGRHGPTDFEVLRKCGEPSERNASRWLYRQGSTKWLLTFNGNGLLNTVQKL